MLKANSGTSLISLALFVLACSTSSVQAQEIEKNGKLLLDGRAPFHGGGCPERHTGLLRRV